MVTTATPAAPAKAKAVTGSALYIKAKGIKQGLPGYGRRGPGLRITKEQFAAVVKEMHDNPETYAVTSTACDTIAYYVGCPKLKINSAIAFSGASWRAAWKALEGEVPVAKRASKPATVKSSGPVGTGSTPPPAHEAAAA